MTALFEVALTAAFAGGFAGGVHCAGMCGGIVHMLCAGAGRPRGAPALGYLLAFNAGRVTSYACAGALAGALGQAGLLTRAAPMLQPLMFALASLMLVALGFYLAGALPLVSRIEAAGAWLWRGIQPWSRHLLPVTSWRRALGLGALWGWLPCGMVYAVLLTALALGTWWQGAALMLAFGIGTLPNLLGIGIAWRQFDRLRHARAPRVLAGAAVAAFGLYGLANVMHPALAADGGLLCYVIPGLVDWLR
jgi:sulfite exporter TauE/SafE